MKQCLAPLVAASRLGDDLYYHVYNEPDIASEAQPGQFVNVRVSGATAPLLRRPFSICHVDRDKGLFGVFFKTVGEGSEALARASERDRIDIVGPLGTPFEWNGLKRALLVGGGVGIAPLHFLASEIRKQRQHGDNETDIVFAYGARDSNGLALVDEIGGCVDDLVIATEDGSRGLRGFVTGVLGPYLDQNRTVFCCGPTPMMAATHAMMQRRGLDKGWFSLENQMGCAVGVCQGCVVSTRIGFRRVCCDGPVFPADILDFSAPSGVEAP